MKSFGRKVTALSQIQASVCVHVGTYSQGSHLQTFLGPERQWLTRPAWSTSPMEIYWTRPTSELTVIDTLSKSIA